MTSNGRVFFTDFETTAVTEQAEVSTLELTSFGQLTPAGQPAFYFIINCLVDGALCFLGLVGNILTLIAFHTTGPNTSNTVFLRLLAISDSIYLLYGVLYLVLPATALKAFGGQYIKVIVTAVMPLAWTALTLSTWTVMVIAIDRYIVVAFPLKKAKWCTVKKAKVLSAIIVIFALAFNLVRWPRYYFVSFHSNVETNATFLSHLKNDIAGWNRELYRDVYHISLTYIFIFILPMLIISLMNLLLIRQLHASSKRRWKMAITTSAMKKFKEEQNRNSVTHMLVIVISVFLICQLSDFVGAVLSSGYTDIDTASLDYYLAIKEALLILGCSYNFYVYLLFYKRFRLSISAMFGCRQTSNEAEHQPMNSSVYTVNSIASST